MLQKINIKKHLHRGSLHTSALLLAGLSFLGVNEAALEALHDKQHHGEFAAIVPVIAEREVVHHPINLGGAKLPTISGS